LPGEAERELTPADLMGEFRSALARHKPLTALELMFRATNLPDLHPAMLTQGARAVILPALERQVPGRPDPALAEEVARGWSRWYCSPQNRVWASKKLELEFQREKGFTEGVMLEEVMRVQPLAEDALREALLLSWPLLPLNLDHAQAELEKSCSTWGISHHSEVVFCLKWNTPLLWRTFKVFTDVNPTWYMVVIDLFWNRAPNHREPSKRSVNRGRLHGFWTLTGRASGVHRLGGGREWRWTRAADEKVPPDWEGLAWRDGPYLELEASSLRGLLGSHGTSLRWNPIPYKFTRIPQISAERLSLPSGTLILPYYNPPREEGP
jgi:hypothetical protein